MRKFSRVTGAHIPFFPSFPGARHNAARVATNILPGLNTRQGNVAQKLSRIDMAGNARDLSNIWKSTVGSSLSFHRVKAKYLRNRLWTYASKICVNLFMWICERGRGRERKKNSSLLRIDLCSRIEIFISVYFCYFTILQNDSSFERFDDDNFIITKQYR